MGYATAPRQVTKLLGEIPQGDRGTRATLGAMRSAIRVASTQPMVVERAHRIAAGLPPRDMRARALAVRRWLARNFRFERDPRGVELLRTPDYQLAQFTRDGYITGDCDDAAILGAALYTALGGVAALVVVAFRAFRPFTHVFTVLTPGDGGAIVNLDVTKPGGRLPKIARSKLVRV